jgi:hypothetical protein
MLSRQQIEQFEDDGYLPLRGLLSSEQLERIDDAVKRAFSADRGGSGAAQVQHLHGNVIDDPDLAFIVEYAPIVSAVEALLGSPANLSQFDIKLRAPGYAGGEVHYDYKPYRTVGSSLNWLFVMIPLVDYDQQAGPLLVVPGSQRLTQIQPGEGKVRQVRLPDPRWLDPLVDPDLRRGDVLLMHMYTWHKAEANVSDHDRYGLINKYVAADAPPAAGPYLYNEHAYAALSDVGKRLLPDHSARSIAITRLILDDAERVLLVPNGENRWILPGGAATEIADNGNAIAPLKQAVHDSLGLDLPWASYVGDYDEGNDLCRVYAYPLDNRVDAATVALDGARWFDVDQVLNEIPANDFGMGYERQAIDRWSQADVLRGVGWAQPGVNTAAAGG